MRKTDFAFWSVMIMAGIAGITTVLNVTKTYSATTPNSEIYKQLDLFGDVLERVRTDYVEKPEDTKLIESAINGMLAALDPHSAYLVEQDFAQLHAKYPDAKFILTVRDEESWLKSCANHWLGRDAFEVEGDAACGLESDS